MEIVHWQSVGFLMMQHSGSEKFGRLRAARSPAIVQISVVAFSNVWPSWGSY